MKSTRQKWKIIVRRYAPLLPIAIGVYTLLYFLCGGGGLYIGVGFWMSCFYAFMMRFCDDIADYQKDLENNKAPLNLIWLSCGATAMLTGTILLSVIFKLWWLLLPCGLIITPLALGKKKSDWIKPLFAPTIVLAIAVSVFKINLFRWIFAIIVGVADGLLIFVKRK